MNFLIRKNLANELLKPAYGYVSIKMPSPNWAQTTSDLISLPAAAQVLLAGYAVEKLKYEDVWSAVLLTGAQDILAGYISEYDETISSAELRKFKSEHTEKILTYVTIILQNYWKVVEAIANALIQYNTLSE